MVKIAIMGMGVVGGGVADIILKNADTLRNKINSVDKDGIEVKYIMDRRTFEGHPLADRVTGDIDKILSDEEVSIVVEAMGGLHPAFEFTKRALESGKNVVTSNKAVVSAYGPELLAIAAEKNVSYMFEASVGGGIPIIRPLTNCLAANKIKSVYGILNGTTNYILTEMKRNGTAFSDALSDAQKKGYAEADPTADISGADTCRKICILANLTYGIYIVPEDVYYEGITEITTEHLALADKLGYKIKLAGCAYAVDGDKLAVYTAPVALHEDHSIASVDGVYNAVSVTGDYVGDLLFCGQGAGALPTASAVVGDIVDVIKYKPSHNVWKNVGESRLVDYNEIESGYFVCIGGKIDANDITREFGKVKVVLGEDSKAFVAPSATLIQHKAKLERLVNKGAEILADLRILEA